MSPIARLLIVFIAVVDGSIFAIAMMDWIWSIEPTTYGCFGGPDAIQSFLWNPIRSNAAVVGTGTGLILASVVIMTAVLAIKDRIEVRRSLRAAGMPGLR